MNKFDLAAIWTLIVVAFGGWLIGYARILAAIAALEEGENR